MSINADGQDGAMEFAGFRDNYSQKIQLQYIINLLENSNTAMDTSVVQWMCAYFSDDEMMHLIKNVFKADKHDIERIDDRHDSLRALTEYWNKGGRRSTRHTAVIKSLSVKLICWKDEESLLKNKLEELTTAFKLSDLEVESLTFCYLRNNDRLFEDAISDIHRSGRGTYKASVKVMATLLNKSVFEIVPVLQTQSPLRKYGLLDEDLDLTSHISGFLDGLDGKAIASEFFAQFEGEHLPLDYYHGVQDHIQFLTLLLTKKQDDKGRHILFYGKPGTGKTSLARSLARETGKDVYEIKLANEEARSRAKNRRISALYACENTIDLDESIILIDEADDLLNSGTDFLAMLFGQGGEKKGLVNEFIDQSKATCIWITNHYRGVDESVRRRFDYSIEFQAPTITQRIITWQRGIDHHDLSGCFAPDEIKELASRFPVSAGGIDIVLRNIAALCRDNNHSPLEAAKAVLKQHVELMDITKSSNNVEPVKNYSLKGLAIKTDQPLDECIAILKKFGSYLEETSQPEIRNMNMLLYGPPGTGKTEFAKYVAATVGKPLMVKRASDLLDMYVGQTEKMIRDVFRQAEAEQAILFLDEADSLLQGREHAVRGWEVSQVNEILVGMEQFKGTLICSTNFKSRLDSASLRRFNMKVGFDYLDGNGKITFWNLYLKQLLGRPLRGKARKALTEIAPLTPGDFKVVWQKYAFFPKEELSANRLLEALRAEIKHRSSESNAIGFNS